MNEIKYERREREKKIKYQDMITRISLKDLQFYIIQLEAGLDGSEAGRLRVNYSLGPSVITLIILKCRKFQLP